MANHQYELSALNSADLTKAILQARREIHQTVDAMRRMPGDWKHVRLVSTAARDCDNLLMAGRCITPRHPPRTSSLFGCVQSAGSITEPRG